MLHMLQKNVAKRWYSKPWKNTLNSQVSISQDFFRKSPGTLYSWEPDVSAKTFRQKNTETFRQKKHRDVSANFSCRNVPYYFGPVLSWFCFWFSTNWLGPVCRISVCRILELKKNDKTINVGMMESIKRASDMSPFPLVPRGPLGPLIFSSC